MLATLLWPEMRITSPSSTVTQNQKMFPPLAAVCMPWKEPPISARPRGPKKLELSHLPQAPRLE